MAVMQLAIAILVVLSGFAVGCDEEQQTWWGNVQLVSSGEPPLFGGYASAAMATGGWDDPRELGDCMLLGNAPGEEVQAGRLIVRIGDDFEFSISRGAGGYYLSEAIPEWVELNPGVHIEAEAEGHEAIPPFRLQAEYPPYLADVVLPDPDAVAFRDVAVNVSWAPGPGGHRLGLVIQDRTGNTAIGCVADDGLGSLSVPAELMQAFHPNNGELRIKLARCAIAPGDEAGLQEFHLLACHRRVSVVCLDDSIPGGCTCLEGEQPPCYAI